MDKDLAKTLTEMAQAIGNLRADVNELAAKKRVPEPSICKFKKSKNKGSGV